MRIRPNRFQTSLNPVCSVNTPLVVVAVDMPINKTTSMAILQEQSFRRYHCVVELVVQLYGVD